MTAAAAPGARADGVSDAALAVIAAHAPELDAHPAFPSAAFDALAADGALALTATDEPANRAREWAAVRAVARADGSVGRLYEGHLNGVERVAVCRAGAAARSRAGGGPRRPAAARACGAPTRSPTRASRRGWSATATAGACTARRSSAPARAGSTARWCSPAARRAARPRSSYVDLSADAEVDDDWYRAGGMRASVSHRVRFHGAAPARGPGRAGRAGP